MHETPRAKAGDDLTVRIRLFDEQGQPVNLTGVQSIVWQLAKWSATPEPPAVVTRELDDGVTVTDALGGEIVVVTPKAQTKPLGGTYAHKTRIVDVAGRQLTAYYDEQQRFYDLIEIEPEYLDGAP